MLAREWWDQILGERIKVLMAEKADRLFLYGSHKHEDGVRENDFTGWELRDAKLVI